MQIHETDTTTLPLQWETLKSVLWGLFIKHRTKLKADKSCKISYLLKDISALENTHKQNPTLENIILFTDKRIELQILLNEQTLFYQHGNKPG